MGDAVVVDVRAGFATEFVQRTEIEDLILEEQPDTDYGDIGGLETQIEQIRDAVELPFLHPELYREHGLRPPKGVLLYGPPGCGKTLIARAVATSLARTVGGPEGKAYFLNIKGPELLNKFVGETERQIRVIFARARGAGARRRARDRVLRRDGVPLPHPGRRRVLGRRDDDRAPAPRGGGRGGGTRERHHHRCLEP
jgi:proteasome-associated ATPase